MSDRGKKLCLEQTSTFTAFALQATSWIAVQEVHLPPRNDQMFTVEYLHPVPTFQDYDAQLYGCHHTWHK